MRTEKQKAKSRKQKWRLENIFAFCFLLFAFCFSLHFLIFAK
jgi:hypothetical protein